MSILLSTTDSGIVSETGKQLNAFSRYWQNIDWNNLISLAVSKTVIIILICILLLIVRKIGTNILKKMFQKHNIKQDFSERRLQTLYTLSHNFFQYFLIFVWAYSVLTVIGVPVGSLIAGAGIAGIAIGLGAQGFINDVITGFFLILESQLDVGDHVIIDNIEGTVSTIGLRTTQIKSFDGTLHFIPNREILIVSNLSRGNLRLVIDIRIKPDEDLEHIRHILQTVNEEKLADYSEIKSQPNVIGLVDLGNGTFAFRTEMFVLSGSQAKIKTEFMTAYVTALTQSGIMIPESPLNLKV